MGNDIITVLINCENGIEELKETIHSLQNQKDNFWEKTAVIALFDEKAEQESRTEQEAYLNSMEADRGKIRVLGCQNIWNGYEEAMEQADSPYLILMNSGDAVEDEADGIDVRRGLDGADQAEQLRRGIGREHGLGHGAVFQLGELRDAKVTQDKVTLAV